jgi:putative salt-induced outer membrane protein YdiY
MRLLLAFLVLIVPFPLFAQQVVAEPPAHEGKLELSVVATSGNAKTQSIGIAAETTLRPDTWVLRMSLGFVRNEAEGVVSAKSLRTIGRAAHVLKPGVEVFGQHAYLRDLFSGVEHRNSIDAGLSYRLVGTSRHELSAESGFGYLNERRALDEDLSTALATGATRYRFRVSAASDFTDELLLAVDLDEEGTWRLNHSAAITAQINSLMALKLTSALSYVHEPVETFGSTDTVTSASIVMKF